MRKISLVTCFVLFSIISYADNVKGILKKATVYFSGAELIHTVNVSLKQGENQLTIEGLTPNIDINSLKINVNNSVIVASFEFTNNYLTEKKSSDYIQKLKDSIDICNAEISRLTTSIKISSTSLDLLKKGIENNLTNNIEDNQNIVKKQLTVLDINQNIQYYNTKATAIEKLIYNDSLKKSEFVQILARLKLQLRQEQGKRGVFNGILNLNLVASYTTNATVTVSYFTQLAHWIPFYDMVVSNISEPVKLKCKSKISQTTGIDWNNVSIVLSTATPSKTKDAPVFSTWFLDFLYDKYYGDSSLKFASNKSIYDEDISVNETEMSIAMAVKKSDVRGTSSQTSTQPMYIVDGVPFEGDINDINPNSIENMTVLKDASDMYGDRGVNGVIVITTKKMEDYIKVREKNISMEYQIELPYTIPGNGKDQVIDLKDYNLTPEYKYYAAPKLDENVFLIADFKDWEKSSILSGLANITYEGTYVGQTYLNTSQTNNIMSVTLGRDKRVSVKREKMTDFSQLTILGNDKRITLAYKITVKNNQSKPVKFTLKEQYPISSQKEIKIELIEKETTPPTVNKEDTGVITWNFDLDVGQSKEFKIAYTVRYPKDRKINLK